MMEIQFCQSCGMPMNTAADHGTTKDKSQHADYYTYCFQEGSFTKDCTMDEMIEICLGFIDEFNKDADKVYSVDEARANMKQFFPTLKRWAQA